MIALQIQGGPALDRALKLTPVHAAREISTELRAWAVNGTSDFTRARLGRPDDRNRGDFLMRRPRGSQGLRSPTGSLARGLYARSAVVDNLKDVNASVGFLSGKAAQVARVHELGTVRYGGKLRDIVPVRAKALAIPVRNGTAARGVKGLRIVKLKKVGIPPRLGWVAWWTSPKALKSLEARVARAARRAVAKAAPGRG